MLEDAFSAILSAEWEPTLHEPDEAPAVASLKPLTLLAALNYLEGKMLVRTQI
jgi:hypothetical protein